MHRTTIGLLAWGAAAVCGLAGMPPARADEPDRLVLADFEDVGTWRARPVSGVPPEGWFSGNMFLASSQREHGRGRYCGELRFVFAADRGPGEITLEREKASRTSAFIRAVEFEANAKNLPVALAFDIEDSAKRVFRSRPVALSGDAWKTYHLDLNAETVPGFADLRPPAVVRKLRLTAGAGTAGSVYLDDLRVLGRVSKAHKLTVLPVYQGLATTPGQAVEPAYVIRNAAPQPLEATVRLAAGAYGGDAAAEATQRVTLPAGGEATVRFNLGRLPVGSYHATVGVEAGECRANYLDFLAVFTPNNARVNHAPMWFGAQDFNTWQGEEETALHAEWMSALGIDLERVGMIGAWIEPTRGHYECPDLGRMLDLVGKAGRDAVLLYSDAVPAWTQRRPVWRQPPDDYAAFAEHAAHVGRFAAAHPAVKYLEFWNEPDVEFFNGTLADYSAMLTTFAGPFKENAPGVKLTNGGLTVKHPAGKKGFAEAVIKLGANFDLAAFHSHGTYSDYAERHETVTRWLREAGVSRPIGNTEAGARSGYDGAGALAQAVALVQKIACAKSLAASKFYVWFTLQDYWDMDTNADDSLGLVTSDNRPKPALVAYNELIRRLANTTPLPDPALGADLSALAFRKEDGRMVYVCWPRQGAPAARAFVAARGDYDQLDLFGRPLGVVNGGATALLNVSRLPVYLESRQLDDPLKAAPADSAPFDVPESISALAGGGAGVPLRLHNAGAEAETFTATLRDERGTVLGSRAETLAPGRTTEARLDFAAPATRNYESRAVTMTLHSSRAAARDTVLPIAVHFPYPVAKAADGNNPAAIELARAEDVHELAYDPFRPAWKGPQELSLHATLSHDGAHLFFHADVTDARHVQTHPPEQMWQGDSVQVAFALPGGGKPTELLFGLGEAGPSAVCLASPDATQVGRWQIPLEIKRQGTTTSYRAQLPLEKLGMAYRGTPVPFRFALVLNNDDGQGRVRVMQWFGGIAQRKNPDEYGFGILQ